MIQAAQQLYDDLQTRLKKIRPHGLCLLEIEACFDLCHNATQSLHEMIRDKNFACKNEEIFFFRNIMPQFISLEKYYVLLYNHCMFKPDERYKRMKYLERSLVRLNRYNKEQETFYTYYQSDDHHLDHQYFIRVNEEDFTTHGEILISDIIAHRLFAEQIQKEMESI